MESVHVKNAVILAAGRSFSFAPFSYETPKALFKVKGETLVERQIKQLREAGVETIVVVVGSMREKLYFLEQKWGVKIIENSLYASKNNIYSVQCARAYLRDAFLCNCDNYYSENPFLAHRPTACSYRQAVVKSGVDKEFNCYADTAGRITRITTNDAAAPCSLVGYAYWTAAFADAFFSVYDAAAKGLSADRLFWEELVGTHLDKLPMDIKIVNEGTVHEFDSVEDVRAFDPDLIENLNSRIVDNICATLKCDRKDITNIKTVAKGLTNVSFTFTVKGEAFVYRHPGGSSSVTANRPAEYQAQVLAHRLGIDKTLVYIHPTDGWKISRFVPGTYDFTYSDRESLHRVLRLLRQYHTSGGHIDFEYDPIATSDRMMTMACQTDPNLRAEYAEMRQKAGRLYEFTKTDGVPLCPCHGDCYWPNFLISPDSLDLIDWEFAGMCDPANDFGGIVGRDLDFGDEKDIEGLLAVYLGHAPNPFERRHYFSFIAIDAWLYFCWSIYKAGVNEPNGFFMHSCHVQMNRFMDKMLAAYEEKIV